MVLPNSGYFPPGQLPLEPGPQNMFMSSNQGPISQGGFIVPPNPSFFMMNNNSSYLPGYYTPMHQNPFDRAIAPPNQHPFNYRPENPGLGDFANNIPPQLIQPVPNPVPAPNDKKGKITKDDLSLIKRLFEKEK